MFARLMISAVLSLAFLTPAYATPDWAAVGRALGKSGMETEDGVYRVGLPRSDLKVTLDGIELKPAFALGSWLAFKATADGQAMVMGDLVLTHDEVNPVMATLVENGLEITGLHNHLLRSQPATMYMHVQGLGDPVKLAATLHAALQESKTPLSAAPAKDTSSTEIDLDVATIDQVLGHDGKVNGGVYQVSIPRAEPITEDGMEVPASMGTAIAINFQPTGGGKAATTGDFVVTAAEVNPVLQSLRTNGIEVTALHNHMLNEAPRLFFMHFWANDAADRVAKGLRAALDHVSIAKM